MTIISKIREMRNTARRNKDADTTKYLSFLIGELEKITKAKAVGAETTEDEMIQCLKKLQKSQEETLEIINNNISNCSPDKEFEMKNKKFLLLAEINLLESFLPQQMNEESLRKAIQEIADALPEKSCKFMGQMMKTLKEKYAGTYDGKLASNLVKEILG